MSVAAAPQAPATDRTPSPSTGDHAPDASRAVPRARGGGARKAEPRRRGLLAACRGALASAVRWTHPVRSLVTPFGWGAVVATVASALAASRLGWLELWAVAVTVAGALLVAVLFLLGRSAYTVRLVLAHHRVVVGERAVGSVEVRNGTRRPLLPARLELPVGAGTAAFALPRLTPGATHEDLFTVPTRRRSVIQVGPVLSVRGDALGLLRREVRCTDAVDLFVHPRTIPLDGASAGFLRDIEGLPTQDLSSSDVSFHALREYTAGDDRRSIHWRTTARTGRLMVRQFEETRRSHLLVALSTAAADFAGPEEFELAVSAAGSLGLQALKEEKDLTVVVPGRNLRTPTGMLLLDDLSGLEVVAAVDDVTGLVRSAAGAVRDASVAVIVTGTATTPQQLQAASAPLPLGVVRLALRCAPGEPVSRRAIGPLTVLTIGSLTDLPGVMRRAVT